MLGISTIVGKRLDSVEKVDYTWVFCLTGDVSILTQSLWRFIHSGRVHVTSDDHGHPFGLPQPVDAAKFVASVLQGSEVSSVRIDEATGDLFVMFSDKAYLQFLQTSCGYDSWDLTMQGNRTICLGGGNVTAISDREKSG